MTGRADMWWASLVRPIEILGFDIHSLKVSFKNNISYGQFNLIYLQSQDQTHTLEVATESEVRTAAIESVLEDPSLRESNLYMRLLAGCQQYDYIINSK